MLESDFHGKEYGIGNTWKIERVTRTESPMENVTWKHQINVRVRICLVTEI